MSLTGTTKAILTVAMADPVAAAEVAAAVDASTAVTTMVKTATKTVGFADITAAGTTKTIDFASALPAGAIYLGASCNCTAIFDNVGDTASVTFDLGIKSGDTDAFLDGGSLDAVAKVYTPVGVGLVAGGAGVPGYVGAITPSLIFTGDVNLNTLTKGAATFTVHYLDISIA